MKKSVFQRVFVMLFSSLLLFAFLSPSSTYASGDESSWDVQSGGGSSWVTADSLAQKANEAYGNSGFTDGTVDKNVVYEAARIFCGFGFSLQYQYNSTWYVSQNGLKRVRIGVKADGTEQANFEKFSQTGFLNSYRDSNYHVNITSNSSGGSGW